MFEAAGFMDMVDVRLGKGLDVPCRTLLPRIWDRSIFTFIDADKPSNPEYFDWALRLSRSAALSSSTTSSGKEQ
jgi:predicted O-methyltransferase YrrM